MIKRLLFLCIFLSISLLMNAQFMLNGRKVSFDELTSTFLFSISEDYFGKSYNAVVSIDADSAWTNISIDGNLIIDGDSYEFENIQGSKSYTIHAMNAGGEDISASLYFTFLPILNLYGEFGYDYTNGTVSLSNPDGEDEENMLAKLKWRGGTTNAEDKHKRNYHIKFLKENGKKQNRQFFGLRNDNNWLLDAAQIDMSRCRNRTATDLWNDFSEKPYYYDKEDDALTGTRGRFCEVFLNNQYYGIYGMMENVDRKQMQLMDYDEDNNVYHGHLWKLKSYSNSTIMSGIDNLDGTLEESYGVEVKYPDFDDVNPTDYSLYSDAVAFVVNSSDEYFSATVSDYFDIPVMVDYYIFLNVVLGIDNAAKNMFWACYDEQTSKKLTLAVWDLDATVGQNWNNDDDNYRSDAVSPELDLPSSNLFTRLLQCEWFEELKDTRYKKLRQNYFMTDSIISRYSQNINMFIKSGAVSREENRWSFDSDISGRELNLASELEYISDWITQRMEYLDRTFVSTGIVEIYNNDIYDNKIYNLKGQQFNNIIAPGLYIKNGKKIINY